MIFDAYTTLTNAYDVIEEAPADSHSYVLERCKYIPTIEEKIFIACFSYEFYAQMIADAIPYTNEPGQEYSYYEFAEGTVYNVDEYVLFDGKIYRCIKITTGVETPDNVAYFKRADKFKNPQYNWLWIRYLKKLICWSVMFSSVMYRLVKDTAKGVVKNYTDGSSIPATLADLQALKSEAMNDAEDIKRLMLRWVNHNMNTAIESSNCKKNNCKRPTHFGFYTKGWEKYKR